ncbi:major facilitator superfamily domain-containing protein [Endogone sp. FLAS-F59071]|nr:major facilitator superfamily domain-containing protein [Endogone sp. FLAS-F59071]|eukprot:RUS15058.1 major facilitator superfamily domain-containing protein [Endogone sp. FLAS-F59071]
MTDTPTPSFYERHVQPILIIMITSMSQMLDIVNFSALNIALPKISEDLQIEPAKQQWLISAYALTFGGFLLLSGRLSDVYGRKTIFIVGMSLFTIWSLINGFAPNAISLIIFRALQGTGAAMTVPSSVGIIGTYFPNGVRKNRAFFIYGASGAVGFVIGLIIGGILTNTIGWRYLFYITACLSGFFAILSVVVLPANLGMTAASERRLDVGGAALVTVSLLLLVYVLTAGGDMGWKSPIIIVLLVVAVGLLVVFGFYEAWVKNPLMPLGVWRVPKFAVIFFSAALIYAEFQTLTFFASLFMQNVLGYSSLEASIYFLPEGILAVTVCFSMSTFLRYVSETNLLILSMIFLMVGPIPIALATSTSSYWQSLFPSFIITTFGLAIGWNTANIMLMSQFVTEQQGLAGGMFNTALQIGSALGLAITTAVSQAVAGVEGTTEYDLARGYHAVFWMDVVLGAVGLLITVVGLKTRKERREGAEEVVVKVEANNGADEATLDGSEMTLRCAHLKCSQKMPKSEDDVTITVEMPSKESNSEAV